VFDGYRAVPSDGQPVRRVVVTVGTQANYGFRRLLERLVEIIPSNVEVLWQTGSTDVSGLPIDARPKIDHRELTAAIADADAVVAHCGVGSAISCFRVGRRPVLVPRRRSHDEHVDDHQLHLARYLEGRGLTEIAPIVDELSWDLVVASARYRIERDPPPPFVLSHSERWERLVGAQVGRSLGWGSSGDLSGRPGLGRPGRGGPVETGPLV
jgi:UDP-N-acetylglucosamine transferase subunit ALG13